jgi:hypothetical protein
MWFEIASEAVSTVRRALTECVCSFFAEVRELLQWVLAASRGGEKQKTRGA